MIRSIEPQRCILPAETTWRGQLLAKNVGFLLFPTPAYLLSAYPTVFSMIKLSLFFILKNIRPLKLPRKPKGCFGFFPFLFSLFIVILWRVYGDQFSCSFFEECIVSITRVRLPVPKHQFYHLTVTWPSARYLTSPCFNFLMWKSEW